MKLIFNEIEDINLPKKLEIFYDIVKKQILKYQHPLTGLFPLCTSQPLKYHSHVRTNVYCATLLWSLRQAFMVIDDEEGKAYELGQATVKCMRAILFAWMRQADRVELFKTVQNLDTCLHVIINYEKGECIPDFEYKHLQMDCIALYCLQMTQMIKSGLQIIYSKSEVAFIQNLVFYLERSYRIPDYGIWERGSKHNRNITELHASSIGMAKAALDAMSGFNLYGEEGDHSTILFIDIDAQTRNRIILDNLLPRESATKGSDSSHLMILTWPAFAVDDNEKFHSSMNKLMNKFKGRHGFKRFNRDGYMTIYDHEGCYEPGELQKFSGIENEWPMFFAYKIIGHIFQNEFEKALELSRSMDKLLMQDENDEYPWLVKYYYVENVEEVDRERNIHHQTHLKRLPSYHKDSEDKFLWGQSVYLIAKLLITGCLKKSSLDPLGRHTKLHEPKYGHAEKPNNSDDFNKIVIQVSLCAESVRLQQLLATYGIISQTPKEMEPITIWPQDQMIKVASYLGKCDKLQLSGRPPRPIGQLGASKFYCLGTNVILCYSNSFETQEFYLMNDMEILLDEIKNDFAFLSKWWHLKGRPTFCFLIKEDMVKGPGCFDLIRFLVSMKNRTIPNVRIALGRIQNFVKTGAIDHLDFLKSTHMKLTDFKSLVQLNSGWSFQSLFQLSSNENIDELKSLTLDICLCDPVDNMMAISMMSVIFALEDKIISSLSDNDLVKIIFTSKDKLNFDVDILERSQLDTSLLEERKHFKINHTLLAIKANCLRVLAIRHGLYYNLIYDDIKSDVRKTLLLIAKDAAIHQIWPIIRFCSSVLGQLVNSLSPSLSTILVQGKKLTIGSHFDKEIIIDKPLNPNELSQLLNDKIDDLNPIILALQQELIICIYGAITRHKDFFQNIKIIRLSSIIDAVLLMLESKVIGIEHAKKSSSEFHQMIIDELVWNITSIHVRDVAPQFESDIRKSCQSLVKTILFSLKPTEIKKLMLGCLKCRSDDNFNNFFHSSQRGNQMSSQHQIHPYMTNVLFFRQLDSCLGRVPKQFYMAIYSILERSPRGILFRDGILPQLPTLTDMNPTDLNFIDEVERLLRPITHPLYRSLYVEAVMIISIILNRNKEVSFNKIVDVGYIIDQSVGEFKKSIDLNEINSEDLCIKRNTSWPNMIISHEDWRIYEEFASERPGRKNNTACYMARVIVDILLSSELDLNNISNEETCHIS